MFITGINATQTDTVAQFALGTIGTNVVSNVVKVYKYVQYKTAAGPVAAVSGNVAYYYAPGGVSAGSVTAVTSDLSDSAGVGAGVLQSAPANNEYCWIQVRGPATLTTALTAGADGNALTPVGSTDGTLDVSALVTDHICAIAIDASAKIVMCQFPL
jgi:hypothetical protein